MKAIIINRVLQVLAVLGLFISGTLSISKYMKLTLPCGVAKGCDVVNNHPSSIWFGIPVAYFGFGAYVALLLLATVRAMQGPRKNPALIMYGYIVAGTGTIISVGLQVYSLTVIKSFCPWCMASAITMVLTLLGHAALYQAAQTDDLDVPPSKSEPIWLGGLAIVLVAGLFIQTNNLKHAGPAAEVISEEKLKQFKLIPDNPKDFGDKNAPVTVVEFADLMCPACQQSSPKLKEYARQHSGKLRIVFRHFPLDRHKLAQAGAAMAEYAAEKGKFWEFTLGVMSTNKEVEDPEEIYKIAQSVGLDVPDMQRRIFDDKDKLYDRLTEDKNAANFFGVELTPTFFILAPGTKTQAVQSGVLFETLNSPPYSKFWDAK